MEVQVLVGVGSALHVFTCNGITISLDNHVTGAESKACSLC